MPRRFEASEMTVRRDLRVTLTKMGATSLRINEDFDAESYEISFDRAGRRYVFRCDKWDHPLDNFRAAQRTISLLYAAVEEYGTLAEASTIGRPKPGSGADPVVQFFLPFEAMPDDSVLLLPSGKREWWEILGVDRKADREAIRNAYRALARRWHPDNGGDAAMMAKINVAYQEGLDAA